VTLFSGYLTPLIASAPFSGSGPAALLTQDDRHLKIQAKQYSPQAEKATENWQAGHAPA